MANVDVKIDTSGIAFVNGMINGMVEGIEDQTFMGSVLKYTHAELSTRFGFFMDALSQMNKSALMHVYEWGQLGQPNGRLWEEVLRGRGAERTASIIWKASKKTVPVPEALLSPGPSGKSVKPKIHIFYWKAPVMEAGLTVHVEPKLADNLAFLGNSGDIKFSRKPVSFTAGGGHTTGQFTKAYYTYWNTMAQAIYNKDIAPGIESDIVKVGNGISRKRRRTASIASASAEYLKGQNLGSLGLKSVARKYEGGAAARRALLYGG